MDIWECKICGYKAENESEKQAHLKHSTDKDHQELLKEKAKNKIQDIKEETEDTWEDISGHVRKIM